MHIVSDSNWIGLWNLYLRETRRFTKVYTQTIMAPVITTLLFLAVFTLALGSLRQDIAGVPYVDFLAPGLIVMAIAQNAFANTSSSIVISKVQGNIVDTLMPPFTANELTMGIALGGATRGLLVGIAVSIGMKVFVDLQIENIFAILFFGFMTSLMLSLIGIIGGVWAEKYDHIAAVTNFIVTPLAFLSGTFYSIDRLPEAAQKIALFNPFFYMIDGFRSGFIAHSDGSILTGIAVLVIANIILWALCIWIFHSGYKLKP